MRINLEKTTPGYSKQNVLVSINALVDTDIGLYNLIKEQYLDPGVFDIEYFKNSSILDFIETTYFREDDNPLYLIANKDNLNKDLLDAFYIDFYKNVFKDIYDRSTYTDILHLINSFVDTGEIDVTILYYNKYCLDKLKEDQKDQLDSKVNFIYFEDLTSEKLDSYTQIFLRSIYEVDQLPINGFTSPKCFYFSSFRPNIDMKKKDLKRTDVLNELMTGKLHHDISIFDMYNNEVIDCSFKNKDKGEDIS